MDQIQALNYKTTKTVRRCLLPKRDIDKSLEQLLIVFNMVPSDFNVLSSIVNVYIVKNNFEDAKKIFKGFHALVAGEGTSDNLPNKLAVFSGVREFPMRVKCATLAWHTVIAALDGVEDVTTE